MSNIHFVNPNNSNRINYVQLVEESRFNEVCLPCQIQSSSSEDVSPCCCVSGVPTSVDDESSCSQLGGIYFEESCDDITCPKVCCQTDSNGDTYTECISGQCDHLSTTVEFCDPNNFDGSDGCLGECCVDGNSVGQTTQADCYSQGGLWGGLGSTACITPDTCRFPLSENCCETRQSTAAGLTIIVPKNAKEPSFTGTLRATVTGTTSSPVRIHGTEVSAGSINETFLISRDRFNIEPVPCGSNFSSIDISVCWEEEATSVEMLNFSACSGFPVVLSNYEENCITTLDYTGAGASTNAQILIYHDAIIEANGSGPINLNNATISQFGSNNRTLTLQGSNTGTNSIGNISDSTNGGICSIIKDGTGLWRFATNSSFGGSFTVKNGTAVAMVSQSTYGNSGAFGIANSVIVGDDDSNANGIAALLAGVSGVTMRDIVVSAPGGSQEVWLGGNHTTGSSTYSFNSTINLGRDVTLVAAGGGTVNFENTWTNAAGDGDPTANITVGAAEYNGTVKIQGHSLTTTGNITISYGNLLIVGQNNGGFITNPGSLLSSANFTNNTVTFTFSGDPTSGSEYIIFNGPTSNTYGSISIVGTTQTGTYNSSTSTLTIN